MFAPCSFWARILPRSPGASSTRPLKPAWSQDSRISARQPLTPSSTSRQNLPPTQGTSSALTRSWYSDRWLSGLPKDVQQVILDAAKESLVWQRVESPTSEKAFEQKMKDAGVTFTAPDVAPFRKAVEPFLQGIRRQDQCQRSDQEDSRVVDKRTKNAFALYDRQLLPLPAHPAARGRGEEAR